MKSAGSYGDPTRHVAKGATFSPDASSGAGSAIGSPSRDPDAWYSLYVPYCAPSLPVHRHIRDNFPFLFT